MQRIVFYSWQSDLPNSCNRGFIQKALEEAAGSIAADNTVSIEPVIDRDTKGVSGAPDIASTIFAKITAADLFVADVSITTRADDQRPTPNPNVLIELGYALRALGHERIILVFNQSFGEIEELPFDLRTRRILRYAMPEESPERATERRRLNGILNEAIRTGLTTIPVEEPQPILAHEAIAAIDNERPNRTMLLRRALGELFKRISDLEPKKQSAGGTAEDLIDAIDKTQELVAEFAKIVETIAVMNDESMGLETLRWFGKIFERYNTAAGFSGGFNNADFDYFKFLGHEMLTMLVAFLMMEQRWETLTRVLDEPIPMSYIANQGSGEVEWDYASEHLPSLMDEGEKRRRASLQADILRARHSDGGGLAVILPFQDFMAADFFLFLRSQSLLRPNSYVDRVWRPWSCLYLKDNPAFIRNSARTGVAARIIGALNLRSTEEFKSLLLEKRSWLGNLFPGAFRYFPINDEDVQRIATR